MGYEGGYLEFGLWLICYGNLVAQIPKLVLEQMAAIAILEKVAYTE